MAVNRLPIVFRGFFRAGFIQKIVKKIDGDRGRGQTSVSISRNITLLHLISRKFINAHSYTERYLLFHNKPLPESSTQGYMLKPINLILVKMLGNVGKT